MQRRDLFAATLGGVVSFGMFGKTARGFQPSSDDRDEGPGRFVLTAKGTFGTPRWNGDHRVKGMHFIFNSYQPKSTSKY